MWNKTASTALFPGASTGRFLSGQIKIRWKAGYVERRIKKPLKGD
jgi:hypothetical protein